MVSKRIVDDKDFRGLDEWMTLSDAAQYLSPILGKEVDTARVLKYVLNGQLKLSVNLLFGSPAKRCLFNIVELIEFLGTSHEPNGVWEKLKFEDKAFHLEEGIYGLPMIGAGKSVVINEWQKLSGVPLHERVPLIGTVLEGKNGQLYFPLTLSFDNHQFDSKTPSIDSNHISLDSLDIKDILNSVDIDGHLVQLNGLPNDSVLVVRTSDFRKLEENLAGEEKVMENGEKTEKPTVETSTAKVLDPDHSWRSETLALAISAWEALYADRKDSPAEYKPPGGHIALIRDWLKKNAPIGKKPTETAIARMAEVINPDKSKGPKKTKK